jgi:putative DNA primase/helicase
MPLDLIALANLPAALKARKQWLLWKFKPPAKPGGKPIKAPFYASGNTRRGVQGSDADRAGLVTFEGAIDVAARLKMDGVGFAFLPGDGLIGIDIDGAIDVETGEISERAQAIIAACNSYTELSVSKTGVHIIVEGEIDKSFKSNDVGVEVFCGSQYFICTGARWPETPAEPVPITNKVMARLRATVDQAKNKGEARAETSAASVPASNERTKIESALLSISADLGYDEWVKIGMAIHATLGEGGFAVWDYWSSKSLKYAGSKTCEAHWRSFKPRGGITSATIFKMARSNGWRAPREPRVARAKAVERGDNVPPSGDVSVGDVLRDLGFDGPPESFEDAIGISTPLQPSGKSDDPRPWFRHLQRTDKGSIKPTLHNLVLVGQHHEGLRGVFGFDRFPGLVMKMRAPPWEPQEPYASPREWTDVDDTKLRHWLSTHVCEAKEKDVMQAVMLIAQENSFHYLHDYLQGLQWDGVHRLRMWLMTYMGACQGKEFDYLDAAGKDRLLIYTARVGEMWPISAVARVMESAKPHSVLGAKVDTMLILEGMIQGEGKSTALQILGGEHFTDEKLDFANKDSFLILQGSWIVEMSELEGMNKNDASSTKQFIPKRQDFFRPPYGHRPVKKARRCVFAGTVNGDHYLKDDSGNRRFLPVACTQVDLNGLRRDRDQLWAEAVVRYREGVPWWIEKHERAIFTEQQESRYQDDAWHEPIRLYCAGKKMVTTAEVLEEALKIDRARWDKMSQMRAGAVLRRMDWVRRRVGPPAARTWAYCAPEEWSAQTAGDDDEPF